MNPHVIQDAWEQAKLLLVVAGNEWPDAFDSIDIARLSMEPPLRADALVQRLREIPASGGWCCRESNIIGYYQTETCGTDGPASFPVWKRGNDLHYLLVANGRKEQMIARRMHTAEDMHAFYLTREQEPPGLLAAWIAGKSSPKSETPAARPSKPAPQGVTRAEIIDGFRLSKEWDERLKKAPSGRYAPLHGVWTQRGEVGGLAALYSPARVGFALMMRYQNEYGRPLRNERAVSTVLNSTWPDWLDEWNELRGAAPDRR